MNYCSATLIFYLYKDIRVCIMNIDCTYAYVKDISFYSTTINDRDLNHDNLWWLRKLLHSKSYFISLQWFQVSSRLCTSRSGALNVESVNGACRWVGLGWVLDLKASDLKKDVFKAMNLIILLRNCFLN